MNGAQIVKKVIEKAVRDGWHKLGYDELYISSIAKSLIEIKGYYKSSHSGAMKSDLIALEQIIFSYSFAKVLGYKLEDLGRWCDEDKEPIKYLERFLKK